jgi:hypothetical protein
MRVAPAGAADSKSDWILSVLGIQVGGGAADLDLERDTLDEDTFRPYILAKLRQVKLSGTAHFALVLGRKPQEHRMAMHRSVGPRSLAATLVRKTGLHAVTWGVAEPHPERAAVLRLSVEGRLLSGLCKKGGRMLQAHRPLPFARMVLWSAGAELAELPDPLETAMDETDFGVPPPPAETSLQRTALTDAALQRVPFCEECSRT